MPDQLVWVSVIVIVMLRNEVHQTCTMKMCGHPDTFVAIYLTVTTDCCETQPHS